jgi:hypothetical protein
MINKSFFVNKLYRFSAYAIFFLLMAIGGKSLMARLGPQTERERIEREKWYAQRQPFLYDYELKVECQPNFSRNNDRCFQNCPDAMETESDYCVATPQYVGDCPIDFISAPDASGKLRCLRNSYQLTLQCKAGYTPINLSDGGILCKGGCPEGLTRFLGKGVYCYPPSPRDAP